MTAIQSILTRLFLPSTSQHVNARLERDTDTQIAELRQGIADCKSLSECYEMRDQIKDFSMFYGSKREQVIQAYAELNLEVHLKETEVLGGL